MSERSRIVPGESLPGPHDIGAQVTLWQRTKAAMSGFPPAAGPAVRAMRNAVCDWLAAAAVGAR